MRPSTLWERFKACFIWGKWSWHQRPLFLRDDFAGVIVVSKLKVYVPAMRVRHANG